MATGPVALAGSGEFLPVMEPVDRALLQGRARRAAFLPTAAALEGDARVAYWLELGKQHFERLGVEPVAVPVRSREDAEDPAMAALVRDAGLVYLSGGDPHHLAATLRGTTVWSAILEVWRAGAALAGCSAGAMALTAGAPTRVGPRRVDATFARSDDTALTGQGASGHEATGHGASADGSANGLGVVPGLAVVPHFDMIDRWRPGTAERFLAWRPDGTMLVGIDEETALVGEVGPGVAGDGSSWRVEGRGAVWVLEPGGRRRVGPGEELALPASENPAPGA